MRQKWRMLSWEAQEQERIGEEINQPKEDNSMKQTYLDCISVENMREPPNGTA